MNCDVALEELRQLQMIICRHEEHAFKIRNVLYLLLAGLVAGLFSEKLYGTSAFAALAGLSTLLVFLVEISHRAFVRAAIERVGAVEGALSGTKPYDGPKINESLSRAQWLASIPIELRIATTWLHYAAIVLIIAAVWGLGLSQKPSAMESKGTAATQMAVP